MASIFIPDGTIVSTDGRSQPRQVYMAKGDAIATTIPLVVLVDRDTASAAEIVTGALKDRGRAKVVGHPHLRQGRVPGDPAAVQRRRARLHRRRVLHPQRPEPRRRRRPARAPGITPNVYAYDQAARADRHRAESAERTVAAEFSSERARPARRRAQGRGSRSSRARASSWSPSRSSARGRGWWSAATGARTSATWCCVGSGAGRGNGRGAARRASIARRLGPARRRPRRDRGADARPRAAAAVRPGGRARGAGRSPREAELGTATGRRDLRTLPTFTIDPATARDFDDAISAAASRATAPGACGSTSPTCRRSCAPRSLVDREAYRRGDQRLRARRGRADAAARRSPTTPARWCPARTG